MGRRIEAISVFRQLKEVTEEEVAKRRADGLRPGVKALLYSPYGRSVQILLGRLPEGFPKRFNLSGGGVDEGQSATEALKRELLEEMLEEIPEECADEEMLEERGYKEVSLDVPLADIEDAPILAEGELPFPREGMRGKYEYIVGLGCTDVGRLRVATDSKLVLYPPLDLMNAKLSMEVQDMDEFSTFLYGEAVRNLRKLLAVG